MRTNYLMFSGQVPKGAINPEEGLKYAYTNGANFVCLGMYDFQIVEDVNIALNALDQVNVRQRPWMG